MPFSRASAPATTTTGKGPRTHWCPSAMAPSVRSSGCPADEQRRDPPRRGGGPGADQGRPRARADVRHLEAPGCHHSAGGGRVDAPGWRPCDGRHVGPGDSPAPGPAAHGWPRAGIDVRHRPYWEAVHEVCAVFGARPSVTLPDEIVLVPNPSWVKRPWRSVPGGLVVFEAAVRHFRSRGGGRPGPATTDPAAVRVLPRPGVPRAHPHSLLKHHRGDRRARPVARFQGQPRPGGRQR